MDNELGLPPLGAPIPRDDKPRVFASRTGFMCEAPVAHDFQTNQNITMDTPAEVEQSWSHSNQGIPIALSPFHPHPSYSQDQSAANASSCTHGTYNAAGSHSQRRASHTPLQTVHEDAAHEYSVPTNATQFSGPNHSSNVFPLPTNYGSSFQGLAPKLPQTIPLPTNYGSSFQGSASNFAQTFPLPTNYGKSFQGSAPNFAQSFPLPTNHGSFFHGSAPTSNQQVPLQTNSGSQFQDSTSGVAGSGNAQVESGDGNESRPQSNQTNPIKLRTVLEASEDKIRMESISYAPLNFPVGPFCDEDILKSTLQAFASRVDTAQSGFCVIRAKMSVPKGVGRKRPFICHCLKQYGCKWGATYEETAEGWLLFRYKRHVNADGSVTSNHHNHVLIENKYAMHGLRASRGAVPDDLQKIGRIMHTKSGCHPSDIMRILNELAIDQGLSVGGWTIEDIKSLYRPTAGERMFDTANLFCQLQARNATEGLEYYARHEGDRLKSLFVQLDGSIQDWARTGSKNVVLFDPTWGTNKYGLKMCCFTTLTGTGRTVILAMSLLDTETVDNFEWSFRCFADTFKTAPAIIFTDGCDKIRRAIVQVSAVRGDPWFDIRHMLCVYHLSGNLFTHVRHLFRDSFENWKKVLNKFWQIAKKRDYDSINTFDKEWDQLIQYVQANSCDSERKEHEIQWLENLGERSKQWAARFVFQHCTFGMHSSQRSEAIHSAIKKNVTKANHLLVACIQAMEEYNTDARCRHAVEAEILRLKTKRQAIHSCAAVQSLQDILTPYAFKLVLIQQELLLQYKATSATYNTDDEPDPTLEPAPEACWVVTRTNFDLDPTPAVAAFDNDGHPKDFNANIDSCLLDMGILQRRCNKTWCSCLFPSSHGGLPCCHILAACFMFDNHPYDYMHISRKWIKLPSEEIRQMETSLRTMPKPSEVSLPKPCPIPDNTNLTQTQRYRLMVTTFMETARHASTSNIDFSFVMNSIQETDLQMRGGLHRNSVSDKPTSDARPCDNANGREEQVLPTETPKPENSRGKDELDFLATLGMLRTPIETPTINELCNMQLLGMDFAYKQQAKRQGGWWVGSITKATVSIDECCVVLTADFGEDWGDEEHTLYVDDYTTKGAAKKMHGPY